MKKLIIAIGVIAVLGVIVVAAVSRRKTPGEPVYAADVSRGDVVTVVTGTGVIQPRTKVNISSEIYGQIVELPVKEGQAVHKGELLVRIDPEKYRSEVDRLSANLRVNRIAIESEAVSQRNFEIDQKRAKDLYAQGILSSSDREKVDLALESSRIRSKSLRESVVQAEAALERAQSDLGKTRIYAPMEGRVTQVNTEVGEQVILGTTNVPGSVIMVISDMGEVLAEVNVDETEVVKLKAGQSAKVTADAVEKTTYEGRVTEIRNTAKKEGEINVFGVKVLLTHPDERLRPGMTAKARIEVERSENVLRIPLQAVTIRERKKLEEEKKAAGAGAGSIEKTASAKTANAKTTANAVEKASVGSAELASSRKSESASTKRTDSGEGGEGASRGVEDETTKAAHGTAAGATTPAGKGHDEREEIEVVYVIDHDQVRVVPVKTGSSDEMYVEIKDGLKDGQTVVKGPYRILKRLKEGDRIVKKKEEGGEGGMEEESKGGSEEGRQGS